MLILFTHASVSGRRSGSGRVARVAGEGARLGGRGRHAGGSRAAQISARSGAISRSSCIRTPTRSTRSRAASARPHPAIADSASSSGRKSRSRRIFGRRDLTINAMAQAGRRNARRSARRQARSRRPALAARVRRLRRGSGARAAGGAFRRTLRAAGLSRGRPTRMALMRAWCSPTRSTRWWPSVFGRSRRRRCASPPPAAFFKVLRECGALHASIRKSTRCSACRSRARWHPEIDTGVHTLMVLDQAVDAERRFARCGSRRWSTTSARRRAPPAAVAGPPRP